MTTGKKKDNSTYLLKTSLRKNLLRLIDKPIVMETHGGYGAIWNQCYMDVSLGVVFEKDPDKTRALAVQRPTWAVYECDCEAALLAGVGAHLPVNFLDCDPYGEPWPVLDAFFLSKRPFPETLAVVVNDGLRQKLKMNGGWNVASLEEVVSKYGNAALYKNYLEICREMLQEKASQQGYKLTRWKSYYCGYMEQMSHYAALFSRDAG